MKHTIALIAAFLLAPVATLRAAEPRPNILLIVADDLGWSDNGGIEGLKNAYIGKVPDSPLNSENDPLRGQKNALFEGGTRVCAFVNWPGKLQPSKVTAPLYVGDWFSTLAGLTGFKPAEDLKWDGLDRWKIITSEDATPAPRSIYIAHPSGGSLRRGDWKLIALKKGSTQLFNIATDPYEKTKLPDKEPKRLAELTALLAAELAKDDKVLPEDLKGLHD